MSPFIGIIITAAVLTIAFIALSSNKKGNSSDKVNALEDKQQNSGEDIPGKEQDIIPVKTPVEENVILEETSPQSIPEAFNDPKQDLLDFAAAMSGSDSCKNRYSALQNTSFVVQRLAQEYEASGKEGEFYDFVLSFCEKMKFQNGDETYIIAESVARKLKINKRSNNKKAETPKTTTGKQRPLAESFYLMPYTGEEDVDEFVDIAKELLHKRIRHLKTSEKENDEELHRVVKTYRQRTGISFYDFFTNQFQFSYLMERRFQDLYYLLFQIAQAKKKGFSKAQVLQQIDSIYRLDNMEQQTVRERKRSTRERKPKQDAEKVVPFNAYTERQHIIIAVASRISRTYNEYKNFRRTGQLAISLVNKFLEVNEETISERTFYTINLSGLQKEDRKLATVYAILIDVVNMVFQGMTEDEVFLRVSLDKRMPPLPQNKTEKKESRRFMETEKHHSSCLTGKKALVKTIIECGLSTRTQECINLAVYLDSNLNPSIKLSEIDYYKALKSVIEVKQLTSFNSRLLSYILDCKINEVPDVSMRSFVGSKFPAAYRRNKANKH